MELAVFAGAIIIFGIVSLAAARARDWWDTYRRRNRWRIRVATVFASAGVVLVVAIDQAVGTVPADAIGVWVFGVLVVITVLAVLLRRDVQDDPLSRVPVPPDVRAIPGGTHGLYACGFGNRAVNDGRTVTDWKVGHGDIERRISAHTSAVAHPRLVVARLPCDDHQRLERQILRDLGQWKINVRTIPGEELFEAAAEVEAYLRALWDGSGGTWGDRR